MNAAAPPMRSAPRPALTNGMKYFHVSSPLLSSPLLFRCIVLMRTGLAVTHWALFSELVFVTESLSMRYPARIEGGFYCIISSLRLYSL
jgi:hypothetical protein